MVICPVCEHQQDFGVECDVCGKALGGLDGLAPPPVSAPRLADLEVTGYAPAGEVAVAPEAALEVTSHAPTGAVAAPPPQELEATSAGPVGEVAVPRLEDLTQDRAVDDGVRTGAPAGPVTCRYCRHVQAAGALCDRCGMKLPTIIVVPGGPASGARGGVAVKTRCRTCGAPATAGQRCGDCGREVPFPDA